ncbi:MAG TPA: glycosyltransferase family 4 protein [Roseimicrobium sp.]|nr:glycosyltransferase family 4 protein [Roseimicrobium sp.]
MTPSTTAMQRPKVALISSGLGHVLRGIEVWMVELAKHLPRDQIEVLLWSGGPADTSIPGSSSLNGWSRDAALMRGWPWHRRYLIEQWSLIPKTLLRLKEEGIQIAYCGDPVLAWHLKRFRKWHGAKIVFMNGMRLSPSWAQSFDGVHLLAPAYLDEARATLGEGASRPFFAVPHFVDTKQFHPASDTERKEARRRWNLPEDAFVVLNLGPAGLVSGKRLEWIARELAPLGDNIHLVHAGVEENGADTVKGHVHRSLGARSHFLGPVPRADIAALYRVADLYALGSLAEPFSIAILEALASGLPVVHHEDTIMTWQTGGGGVAVSMTQSGKAGEAIRRLMSSDAERRRIGMAGRDLALARYEPSIVCQDLVANLKNLVRKTDIER